MSNKNIQSSKEILAKLMSTENITVEHSNIPTAAFDLINRKLLLPNWKDISNDVYTLLISHEVGHALFTPTDEWSTSVKDDKNNYNDDLKMVINIVEDVRIERLIQRKYPGTIKSFRAGYNELEKSNLFKTHGRDISTYGLLDRLNLQFKLGHYGYLKIPFSDNEIQWVNKVKNCKTFSDVVKVANELKQFIEENPESQGNPETVENCEFSENESQELGDGKNLNESENGDNDQSNKVLSNDDSEDQSDQDNSYDELDNEDMDSQSSVDENSGSQGKGLTCETQSALDSQLKNLADNKETIYANLPNIDVNNFIVPYKIVHKQITDYYTSFFPDHYSSTFSLVNSYKNYTKTVVNQLANIFEMKKKAKLDIKSLTSRTCKLNTNKIYSYRYNEDVFKKVTTIPEGKSHGLIMFLDMSSSMNNSMVSTYEQLLNLVLFCKRINIPFDVYGFTDENYCKTYENQKWNMNDLTISSKFSLRQYFSSKMSGFEFNTALHNILCIMESYKNKYTNIPREERLNTTPLIPSILCARDLIKKMRKENSVDIVNTIFLTDGYDNHGLTYKKNDEYLHETLTQSRYARYSKFSHDIYIRDNESKKTWKLTSQDQTEDVLKILKEISFCNIIGFRLIDNRELKSFLYENIQDSNLSKEYHDFYINNKFCELKNILGYDSYYFLPSGNKLSIHNSDFETDKEVSAPLDDTNKKESKKVIKQIAKDFDKHMKAKYTSRILLNRFIDNIC